MGLSLQNRAPCENEEERSEYNGHRKEKGQSGTGTEEECKVERDTEEDIGNIFFSLMTRYLCWIISDWVFADIFKYKYIYHSTLFTTHWY